MELTQICIVKPSDVVLIYTSDCSHEVEDTAIFHDEVSPVMLAGSYKCIILVANQ